VTYRALLIGNSVYEEDAALQRLNAPGKDVVQLHQALVDTRTGMFHADDVQVAMELTSDQILDDLDEFFSLGKREDVMLMYYSGHGLLNERNQLFLCGRNTRSDRLYRTAVSNARVNEFIEQSMSRTTIVVVDCCAAGMFKSGPVGEQLAGPGRYVISSTRGADRANDAARRTGMSMFTEHVVAGLLGEARDADEDGFINLREIYDYARERLSATGKQRPHCRFDGDGDIRLARVFGSPLAAPGAGTEPERHEPPDPTQRPEPSPHHLRADSRPPQPVDLGPPAPQPSHSGSPPQPVYSGPPPLPVYAGPPPLSGPMLASPQPPPAVGNPGIPGQASGESPKAQMALTLGICSLGVLPLCGVTIVVAPWALVTAQQASREITASRGRLTGSGKVTTARVLALSALVLNLFWVLVYILMATGESSST
jgi:hypothetical protein